MELTNDYKFKINGDVHIQSVEEYYVLIFKDTHKYLVVNNDQYNAFEKLKEGKEVGIVFENTNIDEELYINLLSDIFWANTYEEPKKLTDPDQFEIKFDITYDCNTRCSHCFLPDFPGMNEISLEKWKKISDKIFDNIDYKPYMCISGGEPLLFSDMLKELIEYIYPKVESIALLTNGFIISDWIDSGNKEMLDFFTNHIETFQISLDGYDEETFDKIRGKGNFKKLVNTVKYFNSIGKPMSLHATVSKENIKSIEDNFLNFVTEHDLYGPEKNHFSFSLVRPLGRGKDLEKKGDILNGIQFEKFLYGVQEKINEKYPENLMKTDDLLTGTLCSVGRQISVAPNGLCYLCGISATEPTCNLLEDDFSYIKDKYKKLRESMEQKNIEACNDCELFGFCFGKCRVINKLETGSYTKINCDDAQKEEFYRAMVREKVVGVPF
ncbi:radical SAM protein [Peptostreptococcaceae bacterium AGR-M142]